MRETFADYLMRKGDFRSYFDETVIINATAWLDSELNYSARDLAGLHLPFNDMWIELHDFTSAFGDSHLVDGAIYNPNRLILMAKYAGIRVKVLKSSIQVDGIVLDIDEDGKWYETGSTWAIKYNQQDGIDNDVSSEQKWIKSKSVLAQELYVNPMNYNPFLGRTLESVGAKTFNFLHEAFVFTVCSMNKKAPIEFVDYPRNYRRRVKRKTGKEPSPYFRIINPEQPQKRYENAPATARNEKTTMPLHIVRGHFRHVENHPIEHFNGTFWIAPHTRGSKDNGMSGKRGYTIRLPEAS